jgi:hypothetical protein
MKLKIGRFFLVMDVFHLVAGLVISDAGEGSSANYKY